jgi:hypothetical protein
VPVSETVPPETVVLPDVTAVPTVVVPVPPKVIALELALRLLMDRPLAE